MSIIYTYDAPTYSTVSKRYVSIGLVPRAPMEIR